MYTELLVNRNVNQLSRLQTANTETQIYLSPAFEVKHARDTSLIFSTDNNEKTLSTI